MGLVVYCKKMNIPNSITITRIILIPVMWFYALRGNVFAVGALLGAAGLTDFLDGLFARKLKQETKLGAKLDSIADNLILVSVIIWIFMLAPEIFFENRIFLSSAILLEIIALGYPLITRKRVVEFHMLSNKADAFLGFVFFTHAFIFSYNRIFLFILIIVSIISSLEKIIALKLNMQIDEHTKTIFPLEKFNKK